MFGETTGGYDVTSKSAPLVCRSSTCTSLYLLTVPRWPEILYLVCTTYYAEQNVIYDQWFRTRWFLFTTILLLLDGFLLLFYPYAKCSYPST